MKTQKQQWLTVVVTRVFGWDENVLTASYRRKQLHTFRFISCDGLSEARRWRAWEEDWMRSPQAFIEAETVPLKLGDYF